MHAPFLLPIEPMNFEVETFAKIKNVPVFRAGTHNGLTFSESEIDDMIASTNECLPFLMESIQQGAYRENEHLAHIKKIPPLLNLGHGRFLADSLKDLVKDVSVSFTKQGEWIAATYENVKSDVAEFLRERFPLRSVELIPSLYNPQTGKTYKNVIRSVAFLPGDIPPAVAGQSADLAIEFEEQPILTVVSKFEEEKEPMKDEITGAELDAQKEAQQIAEFAAMQAQIAEFEARLSKAEAEKATIEKRLNEAETKNAVKEIEIFCAKLVHEYNASPAFMEKVKPLLMQETNGVITFGASEDLIKGFVEWAVKNAESIAVAIGEKAAADTEQPAPKDPQEARKFALEQVAKERGLDMNKDYPKVWKFAAEANPNLFA